MEPPICKADLQIHTTRSDGVATLPELLDHVAKDTDLHAIAITDHDSITVARQAAKLARQFGVEVIIGEKVSTADGHLLALFIDTDARPNPGLSHPKPRVPLLAVGESPGYSSAINHAARLRYPRGRRS